MIPGSLLLATAPQRFPADRLGFSACHAAECGFAVVDSVRESGAAAPGKCRRCCVRDWPGARRRSAPTLPQRGLCGCAASPRPVFSAPAHGTRSRVLRLEREHSALQEAFPLYTVLPKRRGEDRKGGDETKGEQPTAHRKTARCNSSSCCNKRTGSSACATSVSSCCFWTGKTPERSNRCNGVLAGS